MRAKSMRGLVWRLAMKRLRYLPLVFTLLATSLFGQNKIIISAGTPEDKALTEIGQQSDPEKRVTMLEDFVKQYASNSAAVAYGNWQLSQQYVNSDPAKALDYGDKALAAMPDVLDILQTQTDLAQQMKSYGKVVDYATRGAVVIKAIDKQPKPDGISDDDWKNQLASQNAAAAPIYDYLAAAAYNAMAGEPDPKKRIEEIERFSEAFQGSKVADNANVLAVQTYMELNDMVKLTSFGEKSLAADPNNTALLTLLANAFAEDPKGANLAKADSYARKAIELLKSDANAQLANREIQEGFDHEILGYTLLRQEKTAAAILELKTASTMVKSDSAKYSVVLYRLGFAYGKDKQTANARQVLAECATVDGPFKEASRELLAKLGPVHQARR
jgi:hypothetical protein